jgi:hypothetical protein
MDMMLWIPGLLEGVMRAAIELIVLNELLRAVGVGVLGDAR